MAIVFRYGVQAGYDALNPPVADELYFITDTHRLYKGADLIAAGVNLVTAKPADDEAIEGVLYVQMEGEGAPKMYVKNGSTVVEASSSIADGSITFDKLAADAVATAISGSPVDTKLATEKAVSDAIAAAIADKVTDTELAAYDVAFTGVSAAPNATAGETGTILTFTRKSGEDPVTVKIADLFLSAASYDSGSHILTLTVSGAEDPVTVDLGALIPQAVSTEDVALADDIVVTTNVGNFTRGMTISKEDTADLQTFLVKMLSSDSNPTTSQPSASITLTGAGAKEVGETFTVNYSANLNVGSYSNNKDGAQPTGVTATAWAVTDTDDHSATTQTGNFENYSFTVADNTNYRVAVTVTHSAGNVPTTFLGEPYPAGQIQAGTKSANSSYVTGYRQGFYGSLTSKEATVDSALVRGLTGKFNKKAAKNQTYTISVPAGTMRVVLAYESSVGEVASITSAEQFGSEIKDSFALQKVQVNDASGANPKEYNVYVKDLAAAQANATTYSVKL